MFRPVKHWLNTCAKNACDYSRENNLHKLNQYFDHQINNKEIIYSIKIYTNIVNTTCIKKTGILIANDEKISYTSLIHASVRT